MAFDFGGGGGFGGVGPRMAESDVEVLEASCRADLLGGLRLQSGLMPTKASVRFFLTLSAKPSPMVFMVPTANYHKVHLTMGPEADRYSPRPRFAPGNNGCATALYPSSPTRSC